MVLSSNHSVVLALLLGVAFAAFPGAARGVGFFLEQDSSYFPDFDPDGSRLTAVMEAGAVRYGRMVRDNWGIGLSYRYAPPGTTASVANSAVHSFEMVPVAGGSTAERALVASIVFNGGTSWYFDPTPLDDIEFDFSPEMYAQLSTERRHAGFTGEVPLRLETSYEGTAHSGIQGIDALSVALHEMGHVLGVLGTFKEAADGDYDLNPDFLHGAQVAAMTLAGDPNHLPVRGSLMDPAIGARTRTLPSALDVFAMAAASGWRQIDLPRKEFWGAPAPSAGGSSEAEWLDPFNWSGNRLPDLDDDVHVRSGGRVRIGDSGGGQAQAGVLFVEEATTLVLDGGRLVAEELHLGTGAGLELVSGSVFADRLFADAAATLSLSLDGANQASLVFLDGAILAGQLELAVASNYLPGIGDTHTLLVTQQLTGGFDQVTVTAAEVLDGLNVLLDITEVPVPNAPPLTTLLARVVLEGDTNADGVVDQADLDTVLLGWGQPVAAARVRSGDLDGNAVVDQADLDRVLLNWGNVAALGSTAGVPEPSTLALLLVAAGLGLGLRWKKRG